MDNYKNKRNSSKKLKKRHLRDKNKIEEKIIIGLERLSELFSIATTKLGKKFNLNKQQVQVILNLKNKPENLKTLQEKTGQDKSALSKSLKDLKAKRIISYNEGKDKREKIIFLTEKAEKIRNIMEDFAFVRKTLNKIEDKEKEIIYEFILDSIKQAIEIGLIRYQNMCYTCIFFRKKGEKMFCLYLEKEINLKDVMIDCKDYMKSNKNNYQI